MIVSKLARHLCLTEWLGSFGIAGTVFRQKDYAVHSAVREQAHSIHMCPRRRVGLTRRFARTAWLFAVKFSGMKPKHVHPIVQTTRPRESEYAQTPVVLRGRPKIAGYWL